MGELDDIADGLIEDAEPFPQSDALYNPVGFDDVRRYKKKRLTDFEMDLAVSLGDNPRVSRPHRLEPSRSFALNNPIGENSVRKTIKKKRSLVSRIIKSDERYAVKWTDHIGGNYVKAFGTKEMAGAFRERLLAHPDVTEVTRIFKVHSR